MNQSRTNYLLMENKGKKLLRQINDIFKDCIETSFMSCNPEAYPSLPLGTSIGSVLLVIEFENKHGAQIVWHAYSHGSESMLWELNYVKDGKLREDTEREGWLDNDQVIDFLKNISKQ